MQVESIICILSQETILYMLSSMFVCFFMLYIIPTFLSILSVILVFMYTDFFSALGSMLCGIGTILGLYWAIRNFNLLKRQIDNQDRERENDKQNEKEKFYLEQFVQVIDSLTKFKKDNIIKYKFISLSKDIKDKDLLLNESFDDLEGMYNDILSCLKNTCFCGNEDWNGYESAKDQLDNWIDGHKYADEMGGLSPKEKKEREELQEDFDNEKWKFLFDEYCIGKNDWELCQGKTEHEIQKQAVKILINRKHKNVLFPYACHLCVLGGYVKDLQNTSKLSDFEIKEKKKMFKRRFYISVSNSEIRFVKILKQEYDVLEYLVD